mmetsp:Transcript_10403/g.15889  ORF Transcript_10403/g.15889 Transcript_10403/m.15889 type:complete len:95 (-) Transcript_10403:1190-1474(-)
MKYFVITFSRWTEHMASMLAISNCLAFEAVSRTKTPVSQLALSLHLECQDVVFHSEQSHIIVALKVTQTQAVTDATLAMAEYKVQHLDLHHTSH